MSAPYKGFGLITPSTLPPWGTQEYTNWTNLVDTVTGDVINPQYDPTGHKHSSLYMGGISSTITAVECDGLAPSVHLTADSTTNITMVGSSTQTCTILTGATNNGATIVVSGHFPTPELELATGLLGTSGNQQRITLIGGSTATIELSTLCSNGGAKALLDSLGTFSIDMIAGSVNVSSITMSSDSPFVGLTAGTAADVSLSLSAGSGISLYANSTSIVLYSGMEIALQAGASSYVVASILQTAGAFAANGATPQTAAVVGNAASTAGDVITLANNLRTALINNGIAKTA